MSGMKRPLHFLRFLFRAAAAHANKVRDSPWAVRRCNPADAQPLALAERVHAAIGGQRHCVPQVDGDFHDIIALKPLDERGPIPMLHIPVTEVAICVVAPRVERTNIGSTEG
jgi:hypothetical protein